MFLAAVALPCLVLYHRAVVPPGDLLGAAAMPWSSQPRVAPAPAPAPAHRPYPAATRRSRLCPASHGPFLAAALPPRHCRPFASRAGDLLGAAVMPWPVA